MALVEIIMPKMGESVMEATVLAWLKKEGDTVEQDESLLEVATDKVDTEVPSTHQGVIQEILAKEGDVVEVGKTIAILVTEDSIKKAPGTIPEKKKSNGRPVVHEPMYAEGDENDNGIRAGIPFLDSDRFYSPLVKNIARKEGIPLDELDRLPGSGMEGRVTKQDILAYIKNRKVLQGKQGQEPLHDMTDGVLLTHEGDEIMEMDRMRKMIAERMLSSKSTSAHVTSFVEADVTTIVNWRNKIKQTFKDRHGESITFTPIFVEAVAKAIKDFPNINIQVDGTKIIRKKEINIGMAVALPTGNLIVPVIKNADKLSLFDLTRRVNDLSDRARRGELMPDELSGGTYSISNVGSFGNLMGTPIIVQPQVAILALGTIRKIPAVIETPQGDTIGIRQKMFLSHSYDHRVVDGALGGMVVRRIADYLENFDINRAI